MNLIRINDNVLINPDKISFIERTKTKVIVAVDGKMHTIENKIDLDNFFNELKLSTNNLWGAQYFAG